MMRFRITRTSLSANSDESPCPEAVRGPIGDRKAWFIEVESLDKLITFAAKYDELIVVGSDPPSIEIYDDYRE